MSTAQALGTSCNVLLMSEEPLLLCFGSHRTWRFYVFMEL